LLGALLTLSTGAAGRKREKEPPFKFVGGTMALAAGCEGIVEMMATDMVFRCSHGDVTIPYTSIRRMEYRTNLSKEVRKMKILWAVKPQVGGSVFGKKENRYFTVVYGESGPTEALVLKVSPDDMRPYLAELDLKSGHRVEVMNNEKYD
jgi:hypothetical protein